ncbi:SMC-Scp complex subunit ScpB [Patescibacteria group bacterium]|nr:SMC-Scp complex subunit ScpB [Patescibacteria group bacterium]MBU1448363.1 SMC-Scp complex subunit ScpB [Patescibacteria group bacterium]MBU2613448.1 SMC-Scp complex subunit ScpB [Patescibacteria group bacterium]
MTYATSIEAILFASSKPVAIKRLAELLSIPSDDVSAALKDLSDALDGRESGLVLQRNGHEVQLVTHPDAAELVKQTIKAEASGELTRPQLEALTILAYRGPMTRPEVEQIRGIQSSLILRNLMMRGLVEEKGDERLGQPVFSVSFDFLNAIGVSSVEDLPEYETLRGHAAVADVLTQLETQATNPSESHA